MVLPIHVMLFRTKVFVEQLDRPGRGRVLYNPDLREAPIDGGDIIEPRAMAQKMIPQSFGRLGMVEAISHAFFYYPVVVPSQKARLLFRVEHVLDVGQGFALMSAKVLPLHQGQLHLTVKTVLSSSALLCSLSALKSWGR